MALQARQRFMRRDLPEDDVGMARLARIEAPGGEHTSVGTEGKRRDRRRMGFPAVR